MRARVVLLLAAGALAAVSCSSGDADDEAARVHRCLDRVGYGDEAPADVDHQRQQDPTFDAAITRCYRDVGIDLPAAGELTRSLDRIVLVEVRCLRDRGWHVPDPRRGDEGALN